MSTPFHPLDRAFSYASFLRIMKEQKLTLDSLLPHHRHQLMVFIEQRTAEMDIEYKQLMTTMNLLTPFSDPIES